MDNVPPSIRKRIGKNLHRRPDHPVGIVKRLVEAALPGFVSIDDLSPVVSVRDNFDVLRIPADHPSRKTSDTYYVDATHVLRTHTSAHQVPLLAAGHERFLVAGDVYRKDEIDESHYPVFHQLEGVCLTTNPADELRRTLAALLGTLFPGAEWRLREDRFPFTDPSWEVEVRHAGQWLEILGCGVVHPEVLAAAGVRGEGWAFGLGLDRIAMRLFGIPDIRLLWSDDPRFHEQFRDGRVREFRPWSKFPACSKDVSFWLPESYERNDMLELVRSLGGDLVERVELKDRFAREGRRSEMWRIVYRSWERSLTNDEINSLQEEIRRELVARLGVVLR